MLLPLISNDFLVGAVVKLCIISGVNNLPLNTP